VTISPRAGSILLLAVLAAAASADDGGAADLADEGVRLAQAGRYEEAVRSLEKAAKAAPDDESIKRSLGRCEANWGVQLLEKGEFVAAEMATRKARDLLPNDAVVRLNLAACLDERGYPARAAVEVKKAVELAPDSPSARDRLGGVHYRDGRVEEAVAEWEKSAKLGPPSPDLVQRLAKAKASIAAEARLARQTSAHFEIRFDMEKDAVLASKVLVALEEAHGVVGAELQRFGQERLVVVLLPTDDFQSVTGAHGWVAGLYDGRIRLPVKGAEQRESELFQRARHEYVHSVLAPLGKRAPGWLHEGLAQLFEGRSAAQALRRVAGEDALPFASLSQSFAETRSGELARRKYDAALAFVAWLKDGVRAASFRASMSALFDDKDLADAFRAGYEATPAELYGKFQASVPR
jgi:Flp pilus assembly protein TadD